MALFSGGRQGCRQGQLLGKSLPNPEMDERQDSIFQNLPFVRRHLRKSFQLGQGVRKVISAIRMALCAMEVRGSFRLSLHHSSLLLVIRGSESAEITLNGLAYNT